MSDDDSRKPVPVREAAESLRGKPTPVRELAGDPASQIPDADVAEASIEVEGEPWTVRVTGRSGGAAGTAPPLLLLGFWQGEPEGDPSREVLVVGRSLPAISPVALREAFQRATEPPDRDRRKPFFSEASRSRRR
ncbi:MAG: hypothetical protein PVJ80_06080 [Gemmatimonadota bacterium]|jgi:hypothetical protein